MLRYLSFWPSISMVYSDRPCEPCGKIWNTVCDAFKGVALPPVDAPPLPAPTPPPALPPPPCEGAAPPSSGAIQPANPAANSGRNRTPMSAQVRAVRESPRRTTRGVKVSVVNLETVPSGPKTLAISVGAASILELGSNGYLAARTRWKGSCTCAAQTRLTSVSVGPTITAKACIKGRTSSGRSEARAVSVMPTSICSSTYFNASASSDPVAARVAAINWRAAGPGSP